MKEMRVFCLSYHVRKVLVFEKNVAVFCDNLSQLHNLNYGKDIDV